MLIKACLVLSIIFHAQIVSAQDIDLGETKITQEQIKKIEAALTRTTEDRYLLHWTSKATGMRWISQGKIDFGEVQFYNTPTEAKQVYGPGIYLAEKPTSSMIYGQVPVSFKISKGTPIYDAKIIKEILGKDLSLKDASKLGEHIPFLRPAVDDWFVINHPQHTSELGYGRKIFPEAKVYVSYNTNWTQFKLKKDFGPLIQSGNQDAIYLRNVFDASDYMDGISFARAMKVNPSAPWNEFEPQNFSNYQKVVDEFSEKVEALRYRGRSTIEELTLDVQTSFTNKKHITDLKETLRNEGIRAGGDEAGKSFMVNAEQLSVLKNNPYLEVVSEPQGKNYLVHYFYPDALHYKGLKGKITPELYAKLEKQNPEALLKDHELRTSLNKQLIDELMQDFFTRFKKNEATWVDLISIHPFEDMNGRTVRMLQDLYANGENHFILGDIDLLLPVSQQEIYWKRSAKSHEKFQIAMIDEFLMAKTEKRMPDYLKTDALKNYVNQAFPTLMDIDLDNPKTLDQIRNRQWLPLLENGSENGFNGVRRLYQAPETKSLAIKEISLMSQQETLPSLTTKIQRELLDITGEILADTKTQLSDKVLTFKGYENLIKTVGTTEDESSRPSIKIKMKLMKELKAQVQKTTKLIDNSDIPELMKQLEGDNTRYLNHLISMLSESNSHEERILLTKAIVNEYSMLARTPEFTKMNPADQKRVLMATQGFIEKSVLIKEQDLGHFAVNSYESLYQKAKDESKLAMPTVDKLTTWSRRGPGNCTLVDLLQKLGP